MSRTPPKDVIEQLRKEIGFGCPINGCNSPYLSWHHFDPPWNEREHHDPQGMIALCREHHDKADVGAFTKQQLHEYKLQAKEKAKVITGRFDWMRNRLLAVVGGNFYYENSIILQYRDTPMIWFNRDENGYLLLNLRMLSIFNEPRLVIYDNFWMQMGNVSDFECKPSGKMIKAVYANGDMIQVEFYEVNSSDDLAKRFIGVDTKFWDILFPITIVEIQEKIGGTPLEFGPRYSKIGSNTFTNCFFSYNSVGFHIS